MPLTTPSTITRLAPEDSPFSIQPASIKKVKKKHLLETYRTMHVSRRLDEKMLILLKLWLVEPLQYKVTNCSDTIWIILDNIEAIA